MKQLQNLILLVVAVLFLISCTEQHAHQEGETAAEGTSFTCPMHPQIVQDTPGSCPICGMDLVAVPKPPVQKEPATSYTCPMHPQIVEEKPGSCPICGMDLVPVQKQTAGGAEENSIMLSDNQIKLGNITTRAVQTGQVGSNTVLTGRLVVDQTQADLISSRAAGRIERLYVKETGQPIRRGQPLYDLYSENLLTLEQEYLLAIDQVKAFPGEKQFASILDAAERKLLLTGLTKAQINRLRRTRRFDTRITFVAPASGTITEIAASEGMYVAEGSPLYRVSRFSALWVEAELYAQEARQLKVGSAVEVKVPGVEAPIKTRISFVNPEYRQNSQVVVARAQIPNPQGNLIAGTQATITLPAAQSQQLTLPLEAVIRDAKGAHVWVKTGENTFNPRKVTLGEESAQHVAIASGLTAKDTVVVTGAYLLNSEFVLKKGADPMAGHSH
ncbi:efflux RND transporter periplasmic adaptor subunit [Rufibacter sediminis]|uniref:Efflux RND transporter periplasmic adaptor subunit n=1 Tax=Rufibacter sediminis TaxID=2762756 RepID=A0ABR6VSC9_9BACT|nr:efflux RND transporter periplasmic adaptor subunit [Rufibacter sediminis]MBC3539829.1 efflux RND transporter periplasmic adaptor subunit [Rufibacter sediminis]